MKGFVLVKPLKWDLTGTPVGVVWEAKDPETGDKIGVVLTGVYRTDPLPAGAEGKSVADEIGPPPGWIVAAVQGVKVLAGDEHDPPSTECVDRFCRALSLTAGLLPQGAKRLAVWNLGLAFDRNPPRSHVAMAAWIAVLWDAGVAAGVPEETMEEMLTPATKLLGE